MISPALMQAILDQYTLALDGVHGVTHWARVLENGRRLAARTNANVAVVQLFAIFHDAKRRNEGLDHGHGQRSADYAADLRGTLFTLTDHEFSLLYTACAHHTDGLTEGDVTVRTCWDADRLDLGRVGIEPAAPYLCTEAAHNAEILAWANRRSRTRSVPKLMQAEWGIEL